MVELLRLIIIDTNGSSCQWTFFLLTLLSSNYHLFHSVTWDASAVIDALWALACMVSTEWYGSYRDLDVEASSCEGALCSALQASP